MAERASSRAGLETCHELSDALDAGLTQLAEGLQRIAIVAVGGYGRREQCRHSDVDVMLLVEDEDASSDATQQVLYPLWDAGLKVGHSVRTVSETMQASENVETLTALLDGRLVLGLRGALEIASAGDALAWQASGRIAWLHGDAAEISLSATFIDGQKHTTLDRFEDLSHTKLAVKLGF